MFHKNQTILENQIQIQWYFFIAHNPHFICQIDGQTWTIKYVGAT